MAQARCTRRTGSSQSPEWASWAAMGPGRTVPWVTETRGKSGDGRESHWLMRRRASSLRVLQSSGGVVACAGTLWRDVVKGGSSPYLRCGEQQDECETVHERNDT